MSHAEMLALLKQLGITPTDLVQYANDPDGWPHVAMPAVCALFQITNAQATKENV